LPTSKNFGRITKKAASFKHMIGETYIWLKI
jgi:hypothetical protein